MTNRRQVLKTAFGAGVGASLLRPEFLFAREMVRQANGQESETLYVHPAKGRDSNSGAKDAPLKSLTEVARRVNASTGTGAVTAILSEGAGASWNNVPYQAYSEGAPEITVLKITIPAKGVLHWHEHPIRLRRMYSLAKSQSRNKTG